MQFSSWLRVLPLAALVSAGAAQAQALPVTGGTTSVKVTSIATLASLGLTLDGVGGASISPGSDGVPIAYFGVTGGSLDTGTFAGTIEHAGSGLRLSNGSASIEVTDFVIDTAGLQLRGDVRYGSTSLSDVALFDIGLTGSPFLPFSLAITAAAAGALSNVLGIPNVTGAVVGEANTVPITAPVPEPATVLSMLAGLAAIGWRIRSRREPEGAPQPA